MVVTNLIDFAVVVTAGAMKRRDVRTSGVGDQGGDRGREEEPPTFAQRESVLQAVRGPVLLRASLSQTIIMCKKNEVSGFLADLFFRKFVAHLKCFGDTSINVHISSRTTKMCT